MEWDEIKGQVSNNVKEYLVRQYANEILTYFHSRIVSIVYNYTSSLPKHVLSSEFDDLSNIAKIEFIETIKSWDPAVRGDIWSLAYSRITGAMKDHLRYLTKADPARLYDWITSAAYLYLSVNKNGDFQSKIENSIQLSEAMKGLSYIERTIINQRYKNDRTFREIGEEINLSESQVTRIFKEAVSKLKKIIGEDI